MDRATFALTHAAPTPQREPFALCEVKNRPPGGCPNDRCPMRPREGYCICRAIVHQRSRRYSKQLSEDVKMRDTPGDQSVGECLHHPCWPTHIDTSSPCDQIVWHDSGCDSIWTIKVTSEDVGRKWRSVVIGNFQSRQTRSMEDYAGPEGMRLAVSVAGEEPYL